MLKSDFIKRKKTLGGCAFYEYMSDRDNMFSKRMAGSKLAMSNKAGKFFIPANISELQQEQLTTALNSVDAPSFFPTGLAALPYAMGEIYKQKQFQNMVDENGKPILLEDFINIKKKPQFSWMQERVIAKKTDEYGARNEQELDAYYSKGPGQHNVNNPSVDTNVIDTTSENIYLVYTEMEFDQISNMQYSKLGLDINAEKMEEVYKEAGANRRYSLVVGTPFKKGLLRLGIQQTVTADPTDNILGITTAKKVINYDYEDHLKLASAMQTVRTGVYNGTNVSWGSKVICDVPPVLWNKLKEPFTVANNSNAVYPLLYKNALELYRTIANVIFNPLPELSANDDRNPNKGYDCMMFRDFDAVEHDVVQEFGMFGNIVYTKPTLSTASFVGQETRVFPIWSDRIYKIIGI